MPVIEVENLVKRFGRKTALEGVSFNVQEGEIFGILGPNGAGKTTTVNCICGLQTPDAGTVQVLGLDPRRDRAELRKILGVQLQDSELPEQMKVAEALELYSSFYPDPLDASKLIEELGLSEKRHTAFKKLSGGQRQRLSIALALIGNPRVAVLDELTTGLDPQGRQDTWQLIEGIRDRGVTVLLVTHFMEEAERLCDRIALIDAGRVVALDTPARIANRFGSPQRVIFRPSVPFDQALLAELPEVQNISQKGNSVVISGQDNLLQAVAAVLARHQIIAHELRVEQPGLDAAFIALTGKKLVD